ncbi:hypothetical protein GCM10027425_18520 [Alteromonas gracilis]
MTEQTPAGWYPDGLGVTRYWDGSAWTDRTQDRDVPAPSVNKKDGTFSRLRKAAADRSTERRESKEAELRKWAADKAAAGDLVTSGTFGLSSIEIYAGGYVRVASGEPLERPGPGSVRSQMAANLNGGGINSKTRYEKLRSISFKGAGDASTGSAGLEGAVGPAVANLLKGTKHVMKASAPGLAMAGIAHIAGAENRTSYLTITTERQIYTLSNQVPNSMGLKTPKKSHVDVGLALQAAGEAVLGSREPSPPASSPSSAATISPSPAAGAAASASPMGLAERLRELAALHHEGVLSDEEFAAAKAKLLSGL